MRAAKALASLHIYADSPEPLLLKTVISSKISCAGSFVKDLPITLKWSISKDMMQNFNTYHKTFCKSTFEIEYNFRLSLKQYFSSNQ